MAAANRASCPIGIIVAILLLFPLSVSSVVQGQYPIALSYIVWLFAPFFVLPAARRRAYRQTESQLMWALRWVAAMEFLIVTIREQDIGLGALVALAGVVAPTFLYEVGMLLSARATPGRLFGHLYAVMLASIMPAILRAVLVLTQSGYEGLIYSTSSLRSLHTAWPNGVATLAAMAFFLGQYSNSVWARKSSYLCLGVPLLALSRTGVASLVAAIIVRELCDRHRSRRRRIALALLCVCLVAVVFTQKDISPGSTTQRTVALRVSRWRAAIEEWREHPLLGEGLRSFTESVSLYENPFGSGTADTGSAHSDYIDLLVRGGCLYLGLFLISIALMAYRLVRNAKQSAAQLATLLCLTVVMVSACAQNPLKTPQIVSLFWLLIGVAVGSRPVCRAQSRGAIVVCSQSQSA